MVLESDWHLPDVYNVCYGMILLSDVHDLCLKGPSCETSTTALHTCGVEDTARLSKFANCIPSKPKDHSL